MKNLISLLLLATFAAAMSGCGGAPPATPAPVQPTATSVPAISTRVPPLQTRVAPTPESPLLRLLSFVPDTPEYREWLTFGDAAAWHSSWNIPRIDNWAEYERLDRQLAAYWMFIMPRQTAPPESLGIRYLHSEDQRSFYGFDVFNLDRFVGAGEPPDYITVVEFSFDGAEIADALTASGYEAQVLETGGMLYSILDDYEVAMDLPVVTGRTGNLNRIALLDRQMVIAKATGLVTEALLARNGDSPSLADRPDYMAAATALEDPALAETGELVGTILIEGSNLGDVSAYVTLGAPEEILDQLSAYAEGPQLPAFNLVAFATGHTQGASHLILAVVFQQGTDADSAADILADRLQDYVSLKYEMPLDEHWTLNMATGIEAEGFPVALVDMRADDPPPTAEDQETVDATVISWMELVWARDTLFLVTEQSEE